MSETPFSNIFDGLDPIFASEIIDAIGMMPEQLRDTRVMTLLPKVIRFFEREPNWRLTISKILTGKPMVDPLKVLAEYADLRNELEQRQFNVKDSAEKLDKIKLIVEPTHEEALQAFGTYEKAQSDLAVILEEVRLYEK